MERHPAKIMEDAPSTDQPFVDPSPPPDTTTDVVIGGDTYSDDDAGHQRRPLVSKESGSSHQSETITKEDGKQVIVLEDLKDGEIVNVKADHRSPWPLYASPRTKSPDGHQKIGLSSGSRGEPKRDGSFRHQPSPATGWPQRSPIKPDHPHHHHEEASFTLFTQSFDTLSDTGNYLSDIEHSKDRTPRNSRGGPPRRIDLPQKGNESENVVGDISPIKLDDPVRKQQPSHRSRPSATRLEALRGQRYSRPVDFVPAPNYGNYQVGSRRGGYHFEGYDRREAGRPPYYGPYSPSNPFYVLRSSYKSFSSCTYLLTCLKDRIVCPVNLSRYGGHVQNYSEEIRSPCDVDVKIATRRVEAAICAFGGYLKSNEQEPCRQTTSIFRLRNNRNSSPSKSFYDSRFHRRYFINGNHVSWDVEENPPVSSHHDGRGPQSRTGRPNGESTPGRESPNNRSSTDQSTGQHHEVGNSQSSTGSVVAIENQQKMKYRCKLCGQLKQNHNCPYQQSLQRSIAVMVHPAVNAFTASEPGILTKSLSEMNNFVSYDSDKQQSSPDAAYTHTSTREDPTHRAQMKITHVTPETQKTRLLHSPESSLSTNSPDRSSPKHTHHYGAADRTPRQARFYKGSATRKRTFASANEGYGSGGETIGQDSKKSPSPPFAAGTVKLRPEHYRAVTPRTTTSEEDSPAHGGSGGGDYNYPPVPLPFSERKRLSDTLFLLSQEIPNVTMEVSSLLRHAREVDEWDLAVAELLTQLVVGIYCNESDDRLEGLQNYLLGIGVSC